MYNKRLYFAPIAEIVVVDNSDDVLGGDFQIQSLKQGGEDDEAAAKPATPLDFQSEIWDRE
ncbi:MAG: hypothetical protein Q4E68_11970 [Prevotellaceae bacterium]|nr:hypothetical protein [Prevotellaceae bacterium]